MFYCKRPPLPKMLKKSGRLYNETGDIVATAQPLGSDYSIEHMEDDVSMDRMWTNQVINK